MVKFGTRSSVLALFAAAAFSSTVLAAPITSNWTPGNVGSWDSGAIGNAANWTHSSVPATTTSPNNTGGDTFTVNIDNGGGPASRVFLNVNVTVDALNVSGGDELNIQNNRRITFAPNGSVTNNGTINLSSLGNDTGLVFRGASLLTGSGTAVLSNNAGNAIRNTVGSDVLTHGASHTIRGSGSVLGNVGGLNNAGTILATNPAPLTIDPSSFVNNTGTLGAVTGGTLLLGAGTFNNAGGSIEAAGGGSNFRLNASGVIVNGGSFTTTGGGQIRSVAGGALLRNVTFTSGTNVVLNNNEDIRFENGLTNHGTINLNSAGTATDVQFVGTQALTGNGQIVMGQNAANRVIVNTNSTVVTQGGGQTIRGAGQLLANTGGFVNNGAIRQQGGAALVIDPGTPNVGGGANFVNNNVLRSEGTGGLTLNAAIYQNNTTIATTGGGDIRLGSTATEIRGGNLTTTGGGVIRSVANGALLDGVTITSGSNMVLGNNEDIRFRATTANNVNNGTINVNSLGNLTDVIFDGTQTLEGTGEIVMSQNGNNRVIVNANTNVLTLNANQTIRGAGQVLANAGGFVNNGEILQQGAVGLTIDPGSPNVDGNGANFVNNNVLRSEGTGGLTLNAAIYQNNTTIATTGGGDIRLGSTATEIRGGNLTTTGGGVIRSVANGALLDGVTITSGSNMVLGNNEDIRFRATTANNVNNGTINVNSLGNLTDVIFDGTQTLEGTGEIVMGAASFNNRLVVNANTTVVTQSAGHTIRGAGQVLANSGGFVNQGTIIADSATNFLRIDAGTNFSNQGTLRATGAAGFDIDGGTAFTQAGGVVDIRVGSRIDMTQGDYVQTGGHTQVDGTLATVSSGSDINVQGGTFGGTGLVDFNGTGVHALNNTGGMITAGASPGSLTIQDGNFVQGMGGTFEFELDGFVAGVGHDLLNIVNGDADLGGDLSVVADQLFASTLNIGDQFEVVRITNGDFDADGDFVDELFDSISINLAGLNFTQLFMGNSLWIEVTLADVQPPGTQVSEPHMLVILMFGLTVIFWMRRRRVTLH